MNPEAEVKLKQILSKELHELTKDDIAFMKARIMYIGKSSRQKFAKVLDAKPAKEPAKDKQSDAPKTNNDENQDEIKKKLEAAAAAQAPFDTTGEEDDEDADETEENV